MFGVDQDTILSKNNTPSAVEARHYFWYLLKTVKKWSYNRIGEEYGFNHTTVRTALKNFRHKYGGDFRPKEPIN